MALDDESAFQAVQVAHLVGEGVLPFGTLSVGQGLDPQPVVVAEVGLRLLARHRRDRVGVELVPRVHAQRPRAVRLAEEHRLRTLAHRLPAGRHRYLVDALPVPVGVLVQIVAGGREAVRRHGRELGDRIAGQGTEPAQQRPDRMAGRCTAGHERGVDLLQQRPGDRVNPVEQVHQPTAPCRRCAASSASR